MRLNPKKNSNSVMNKIESKRLEPKPTRAKPAAMPSGKGSGVGKVSGNGKATQQNPASPMLPKKGNKKTMRKSPVNAGPLKPTVKRNSMAEKQNKKVYVTPKPKSTAKPNNKKFGK
jgi:hypothetical protein